MWRVTGGRTERCRREEGEVDLLHFPLATTGERYGLIRRVQPPTHRDLESLRRRTTTRPRAALSMWLYLVQGCGEERCGVLHRLNRKSRFGSPLIQITEQGDLVFQAQLTDGRYEAFRTNKALPLRAWLRLDVRLEAAQVQLSVTQGNWTSVSTYQFGSNIHWDDTDGHFVIGGSKDFRSFHGFYGPVKYYRFGAKQINLDLSPKDVLLGLAEFYTECDELKNMAAAYQQEVTAGHFLSALDPLSCPAVWSPTAKRTCEQRWSLETQRKHQAVFNFLRAADKRILKGHLRLQTLRRDLFEEGVASMFAGGLADMDVTEGSRLLLRSASCLGHQRASLLLASLHLSGLGRALDRPQGHMYSLIAASGDGRLALMHAGYKHAQGLDGFPKDMEAAYGYYSNAGAQSQVDAANTHRKQYTPEHVYLWRSEDLARREVIRTDMMYFLKHLAERGDVESQKHLGALLYWGQHGVFRDTAGGLQWLERSALQMNDPNAMYDYSVLLMKGHGVERNYTRAADLLRKAAEMGSVNALNGLGWYHSVVLNDHRGALGYFEQAASNGSGDGMYNMAAYHVNRLIPGRLHDETAAFHLYLNASALGHVGASVEAAHYLSTGRLRGVAQDAERAVRMLKTVCERNGHLGFMIREALQAFLQGSRQEAFVKYVLAAESGFGLAQSNAAHLCEELGYGCQWRYQNYSVLNYDPHPSALLKMADYWLASWSSGPGSLSALVRAVRLYSSAALRGSPQAMFNLFILMQRGHVLPPGVAEFFNASPHDEPDVVLDKILTRCVESEEEAEGPASPCALALLWVRMGRAWRRVSQSAPQRVLVCASFVCVCVFIVAVCLKTSQKQRRPCRRGVATQRPATSSGSPDATSGDAPEQNEMMGGGGACATAGRISVESVCDWALTLAGVCLCALWTILLHHLL